MNILAAIDPAAIADKLEGKSDRWISIALVALMLSFGLWAIRWLVKKFEKLTDKHEETLTTVCKQQNETNLNLAVCIDRNTCAMEEGTEERRKTRDVIDQLQKTLHEK